ncbi:MAG: hypothetical protein Q8K20_09865 [Gemmobacter sp.]|nr:hypothetical protein [Gemmobacter sp.]
MLPSLRRTLTGLAFCLAAPACAGNPGGSGAPGTASALPNPDAISVTGIYQPGTPCSRVIRDDGTALLVPTLLHGITPGARVTVTGERMSDSLGCGGPALVIRGWQPA